MSDLRKEMEVKNQMTIAKLKEDFVAFLFVLWKALGLPQPTPMQISMAKVLASGTHDKFILQAFRGIGKSFITCAYVVWSLWRDPQLKIMIVSASKERADANSTFIKNIIKLLPFLHELLPKPEQRDSVMSFDVGPATPDHSPSVKSVGITGQLTGSRADIIIADDVEIPSNSATQTNRDRLWTLVQEFAALLKPLPTSKTIYLGTPQTEMTLYKELEDNRGYTTIIWPALYPRSKEESLIYGERLSIDIREVYQEDPEFHAGKPTDPIRFDEEDLHKRLIEYGQAGFTLQFMLNPNLSDAERYPLRLRDMVVAALDIDKTPMTYQWLPNRQTALESVPNVGLKGDNYYTYYSVSNSLMDYTMKLMVIDPSGRGKDETGWCILYLANGYVFLMDAGGFRGGYEDKTLLQLADKAKQWKVNEVVFESNFGDGMFGKIFQPVLIKVRQCALTEFRSKGQKEVRIADTLEPVLGAHRLVVNEPVIQSDYSTARDIDGKPSIKYSLFYQLTRLTRDRGALSHDDRLDALAIGVEHLKDHMAKDSKLGESELTIEFLEAHLEDFIKDSGTKSMEVGDVVVTYDYEDYDRLGSMFD